MPLTLYNQESDTDIKMQKESFSLSRQENIFNLTND